MAIFSDIEGEASCVKCKGEWKNLIEKIRIIDFSNYNPSLDIQTTR